MQLDRLRAYDELPGHVCMLERDGHCARYQYPLHPRVVHQAAPDELGAESRDEQYLRTRHFVSLSNRRPSHFRLQIDFHR